MPRYALDHLHLRSPDPDAAARWYVEMLEATQTARQESASGLRVVLNLGGLNLFIERVPAGTPAPPPAPFLGIEHIGLTVTGLDALVDELKARGVTFVVEPFNPRPNVRAAFLEGPERVRIELLERLPG